MDTAINSIDERFTQLKNVNYVFGCICNINEMQNKTSKAVLEDCIKLEKCLSDADSKDVDAAELCGESQAIARRIQNNTTPQEVLKYICESDSVRNLVTAIGVSVAYSSCACGEQFF